MAARAVVAFVAVLALAWLGVMERDLRRQLSGVRAAGARDFARADADFRAARLLNPDTQPDLSRAFRNPRAGRRRGADALVEAVLAREPDNLAAWGLLFTFARDHDQAAVDRALAARRRLDPLSARGG